MKQKIIVLLGLALAVMTSCQDKETVIDIEPVVEEATVPVSFSVGFNNLLAGETVHEPMTRAPGDNLPLVQISNAYSVLIIKKVNDVWILDKLLEKKFDPSDRFNQEPILITDENVNNAMEFETDLRPGTYRMTIFTGTHNMGKFKDLHQGLIVEDENGPKMAYTYRTVDPSYLNPGTLNLQEEIFAGCEPFEVEKTTDLHSEPLMKNIHVTLQRKVSKLRIFLRFEESEAGLNFYNGYLNGITARLNLVDGSQKFPNGLNVWGEPYYNKASPIEEMNFGAFCWAEPQTGSDGRPYILGMRNSSRQLSVFYFSDPEYDIAAEVSRVEVSASANLRINYVYAHPEAESLYNTGEPFYVSLKHNTQFGVVLNPGNEIWEDPRNPGSQLRSMILDEDSPGIPTDYTDLFPYAFEYDNTPQN